MAPATDPLDGPGRPHDRGWLRFLGVLTTPVLFLWVVAHNTEHQAILNPLSLLCFPLAAPLAWLAIVGRDLRRLGPVLRAEAPSVAELEAAEQVVRAGRSAAWSVGGLLAAIQGVQIFVLMESVMWPSLGAATALSHLVAPVLADLFVVSPLEVRLGARRLAATARARGAP